MKKMLAMIGTWFAALACTRADWKPEASTAQETTSPAITLAHKTVAGDRKVELHVVFFNVTHAGLRVADDATGDATLDSAMRAAGCAAGVNGNYFHPDRTSLGLVISDGKQLHGLERAKLLSGFIIFKPGHLALLRVEQYKPDPAITQALQTGPFLVDHGLPVAGLEATRRAERTAVLTDGKGNGALLVCETGVTLAELAEILTTPGVITEWRVERALNLDGGSSTGMWVDAKPGVFYMREIKDVRNYLGIVPR